MPSEDELPIILCNYTDVYYNDFITSEMSLMETTGTWEEIKKFHLEVGDVLITKDSESWEAIAAFLDRETSKIDALISKVETAIERLKEYRTSLISSAVTGKIDVRDEV